MNILIAEDNLLVRKAVKALLMEWGYDVIEAADGDEAWEILNRPEAPKIAILDWMMPGRNGLELCRAVRALPNPEPTYLIILTGLEGNQNIVRAFEAGADDYIHKPLQPEVLRARLQVGKRIVGLQTHQTIVFTFARALELKCRYTQGHSDRVCHYSLALAESLRLSAPDRDVLRRGALLHDIGKIVIPEAILHKPGPLSTAEYDIIKMHPVTGAEMVKPLQSLQDVVPLIRWHHERLDGRGYPDGLMGDEIPFLVRVLSTADVYDALNSTRPYRPAMPHEKCLETLRRTAAEGGLDEEVVEAFVTLPEDAFAGAFGKERRPEPALVG